jgi:hypothetical protein
MPEIALPFAVVGAAAGWLSADLLANPVVMDAGCNRGLAAASAAAVTAAVGRSLTRRFGVSTMWAADRSATWVPLVGSISLAGVITGATVGGLTWLSGSGVFEGAACGLLCAIPALPVCALVVAAARRAARARLGSIVAGSDRRAMWSITMTALAVVTLIALPDWITLGDVFAGAPHAAPAIALGACLVTLALLIADGFARRRVARADVAGMDLRDPGADADHDDPAPDLDFGLGDEVLARVARGGAAYRTRERAAALILGSLDQARAAIRQAMTRGAVGLAITCAVLGCHALNVPREVLIRYHEDQCSRFWAPSCGTAGALLEWAPASVTRRSRAFAAYRKGCAARDEESCKGFSRMERRARTR